ncbi:hypothetical protein [Aliikangiella coralliicola]|uniref:DUF4252 domain-containing protein n=1 Tax=Aliikangiella coralliicola TaxID=2592383 RepID=A0A545UHR8_9GAMM|nr:hypothetical protein [Aliikangiella coralliicola]TQV89012.1 hypothetical protein FLL46_05640 [Aliikangiella coralliicola]
MKSIIKLMSKSIFFLILFCLPYLSNADEVTNAINEGLRQYQKGEFSAATSQLDYAAALIRQQKIGRVITVFPEPLTGWKAEVAGSDSSSELTLGGGITANRIYSLGERQEVEIELMMDSPMLQSMLSMFSNPSMITMSGAKLISVQGIKAMLRVEDGDIEVILIVNNNAMFTLKGYGASEEDVIAYAEALRLDKLS